MKLASQAVAELATSIFGTDWGAPMARVTGINQRTLLRIKAAAAERREYPAARGALGELALQMQYRADECRAVAAAHGVRPGDRPGADEAVPEL